MTDQNKIRNYYKSFDEWGRLDTYPGRLELKIVLEIIDAYIRPPANIFDLGGGAGRYTYELAKLGYDMHLADLSPDLIAIAREKLANFNGQGTIKAIGIANALDLSDFEDDTFENVLLFGPLYHLTDEDEIQTCLREVHRVLQPKGKVFSSFIPYHCGLTSILERSILSPEQVDGTVFSGVYENGTFNNAANYGFQEGKYLRARTLQDHFARAGFEPLELRSIRGIGYRQEEAILALEKQRPEYFRQVMQILHATAGDLPIVETGGHAIYVGEK
ncbi:class I SAM-dependent methyltransferase [Flavilitoribacter nigricans]|uniref:Methyltransferase domain-containing protein n=1 Tax=Flavilitoribacter nigricans (strain ATCC 23147 / DSM 23189 / NBRC 102662 / NCIMB 1420 / SS-2) TaxID=1122177 RepID=A0A2D0N9L1_FLAN2|nr:class I SAM-dependent methyltransferase [Flavilitoribacter nigricans]PHN05211.1 hypothetical protein CRP01_16970 [Flavilitoribacter nigricans DSM 23189 = NBRC 102662]